MSSPLTDFIHDLNEDGAQAFGRFYSIYKGVVESNEDPQFLGRLQVKIPSVHGDDVPTTWVPSKGMPSGVGIGMFMVPQKGDIVWIQFEEGDPRFPVWDYGPWAAGKVPTDARTPSKDQSKAVVIQTAAKQRIVMDGHLKTVRIETPKLFLLMDDNTGTIQWKDASGATEFAVKGETLVSLLNELLADIGTIGGVTVPGASATLPLNTSPQFAPLTAKWTAKWPSALSKLFRFG